MIADYATFRAKIAAPLQRIVFSKAPISGTARFRSLWGGSPIPQGASTVAVVTTSATPGALGVLGQTMQNASTAQRLGRVAMALPSLATLILCDRLCHTGGMSGIVTTTQTLNLPTAPLTRYVSGVGVLAALESYSGLGNTQTTLTTSYTNSDGTAGRVSVMPFAGAPDAQGGSIAFLTLQAGDVGVRSVESVTLAATTGTAGNFGVTLLRPLVTLNGLYSFDRPMVFDAVQNLSLCFPKIQPNACLMWVICTSGGTSAVTSGRLDFIQD